MRIKKLIIIFCGLFICLLMSCNDKEDDDGIIGPNIFLVEIQDPPDIPDLYTQSLIKPKVLIRNEGPTSIFTLDISYSVVMIDSVETKEYGPNTEWTTTIDPGDEIIIELNQWDTINGNTPLINGTYKIYVWLSRCVPTDRTTKDKTFIVEL